MRIWSIHPKYLDNKRLVAVWRESLLARAVLGGKTKAYKNHPQLIRFKNSKNPLLFINSYLYYIYQESVKRNFKFNASKINKSLTNEKILVTDKQVSYELEHLKKKLNYPEYFNEVVVIEINPLFEVVKGEIEGWEKLTNKL